MATRSLRQRSSRYSSPATFGDKEPVSKPVEAPVTRAAQQSSLDSWIEPAVRPAVPSFEDTKGLERLGVLENMQPLGTAPTQRMLQKLKLNYARPSPRPQPAQNEEAATPLPEPEKIDLASPPDEAGRAISTDFPSVSARESDTIVISSPPRGRPPRKDVAEMPLAQTVDVSPSPIKLTFPASAHISPKPASIQEHLRQDRLQRHVDRAIVEAQEKNTPDLVVGLMRLREDAPLAPELWNVLEAIVHNTPDAAQFKVFKRYIKSGIKRFRTSGSGDPYGGPYQPSSLRLDDLTSPEHRDYPLTSATGFLDEKGGRMALQLGIQRLQDTYVSEESPVSPLTMLRTEPIHPGERSSRHATTASPHKRKRSGSVSSASSLSSAKSIPDDEFGPPLARSDRDQPFDRRAPSGRSRSAGQRQATSRTGAGNRLRSAGAATNHSAQTASTAKQPLKKVKKTQEPDHDHDIDELSRRKRFFLDDSFHDYNTIPRPESNERDLVHAHPERPESAERPPPPVIHPNRLVVPAATLTSPVSSQAPPDNILSNGNGRKRAYDEVEGDEIDVITPESSSPGPLLVPPPPGAASSTSRGATPRTTRLHPATKTRKSARVMVSPNKPKNGGITAGISRAGPGRDATIGNLNGADSGAEDNDEFCASCGGEGKLLCCDGCTNSFHHACLEPPLDPDEEVDGEWFCPRCVARRSKETTHPSGLLGPVIRRVDDIIPKAFALPYEVRNYFEGVRTGNEGEYEEFGLPRTQNNVVKMNRAGFIEEPNYKELRDSKGNIIRCYRCNLTANGRDIIPCDYCPARWHLDCMDPPLAVPPRRRAGDKPGAAWRCPLHVEHDLSAIGRQAEAAPGDLGRIPRLRKPKNAVPLDVGVPRGFRNNGIIEIEFMKDQPAFDTTKEVEMHGKVHRIPEEGLRLDFIDRVKKSWYEDQSFPRLMDGRKRIRSDKYRPSSYVLHHPPEQTLVKIRNPDFFTGANALAITETAKANAALRKRSIKEQQTVLSLAQMSQRGIDGYSGDTLVELTNHLISEAPRDVVEAVERTELDQLLRLQSLINRRLATLGQSRDATPASSMIPGDLDDGRYEQQNPNIDPALQMMSVETSSNGKLVNGNTPNDESEGNMADYDGEDVPESESMSSRRYESPSAPVSEKAAAQTYSKATGRDYGELKAQDYDDDVGAKEQGNGGDPNDDFGTLL